MSGISPENVFVIDYQWAIYWHMLKMWPERPHRIWGQPDIGIWMMQDAWWRGFENRQPGINMQQDVSYYYNTCAWAAYMAGRHAGLETWRREEDDWSKQHHI